MIGNQGKESGLEEYMRSDYLSKLENIRNNSGDAETVGLLDSEILKFVETDTKLQGVIIEGH